MTKHSKTKEKTVKLKTRLRKNVCKVCSSLRRTLLKTTIWNLLRMLCVLIFIIVLAVYFIDTTKYSNEEYESDLKEFKPKELKKNEKKELKVHTHPAIVWWNLGFRLEDGTIECSDKIKCDAFAPWYKLPRNSAGAYLFYGSRIIPSVDDFPLPRNPDKVIWALSHEESPRNVPELVHEAALNLFNISSTFSRYSDVPFPLQYFPTTARVEDITSRKHFVTTSVKNSFQKELAPIIYMNTNCDTFSDRDEYVKELMKYIPVDSYGACLNNKKWPEGFPSDYVNSLDDEKILDFIARYKFAIAIENAVCEDYVTEKLWRPIKLGVIPIYYGSPSVKDWLPNKNSAILIEEFSSPKLLSDHLHKLLANDTQYEEYLEHKTKRLISNKRIFDELEKRPYQTDIGHTYSEFECFVCKRLHQNIAKPTLSIVNRTHYDCPIPISALTGKPIDDAVTYWDYYKKNAQDLYVNISSQP